MQAVAHRLSLQIAGVRILLFALALCALVIPAMGQSTATLGGTITDATGAAVPNAKVTAINQATSVASTTQSDSAGAYLFPSLPIGKYRVEVTASGFQKASVTDLDLPVATTVTQNVQLKIGETSVTVEITADAVVLDTTTNSMGQVINDKYVQDIPLNGRHFTDLSLLTPGTITPPANGFLSAPLRGQGSFGINTAGQREDTTNWLVNGINLNDPVQNQITFQPPIDTLSEFKIDNSAFPAEYGRNSGAIVNMATRSGTNNFHGEAFEFIRNNDLDARNFFNFAPNPQAPFKRNEFGAAGGGPIKKNKAFFFLAYEGLRQHQSLTVSSTVPSVNDRATVTSAAVNSLLALIPTANFPETHVPPDPTHDLPGQPNTYTGFTGGTLANVNINQGSADFDFDLREKDRLHGYYVVQKDLRQEPTAGGLIGANIPGFGDTREGFRHLGTLTEDHTFSATLANTVRLGFNRIHLTFLPNGFLDPVKFNIAMPAGSPVASGLPFINVAGTLGFGGPTNEPQGRGDTTGVLNDTLSWLKGKHTFAFGGEIRRAYNNNIAENIGSFTYSTMANFLADKSNAFTDLLGSGNNKILQPAYDGFAQDSFKWKSNLTFNIGLRYGWNSTPSEAAGRFTNFDTTTGTFVSARQPYHTNNKNFQPRIGFAWDPFKTGKTSIRAAYAIMTQAPTTNIINNLSSNPLFAVPLNLGSSSSSITLEKPFTAGSGIPLGPFGTNPNFDNAYAQDWNLTIQREITSTLGLEVAYVGVKGTHLQILQNMNQPLVTNGIYGSTRPFPTLLPTSPVYPAQCGASGCPLGNFSGSGQINSGGNSNYNALWATVNKHFSRGLQFQGSYTFSKSFDYNSLSSGESVFLQNAYNPRGDYGPSEFDVRHRFVLSGFYELPFHANRAVSGWQLGITQQAQTGSPINPTLSIGPGAGITLTVRPDITGPVQTTGSPLQWFANKAVFASPCVAGACHPGNLGRDSITGPGFVNTDFSVTKNTKVSERLNLQFRAEAFDLLNHPNFGNPVLTETSASFGKIQATRFPTGDFGSSRQMQFALKLMF